MIGLKKTNIKNKRLSGKISTASSCKCVRRCYEQPVINSGEMNFRASMQYVYNHSYGAEPLSL